MVRSHDVILHEKCRQGARLPFLSSEPVCRYTIESVTHGQFDTIYLPSQRALPLPIGQYSFSVP